MLIHRRPIQINVKSFPRYAFVFLNIAIFSETGLLKYPCSSLSLSFCWQLDFNTTTSIKKGWDNLTTDYHRWWCVDKYETLQGNDFTFIWMGRRWITTGPAYFKFLHVKSESVWHLSFQEERLIINWNGKLDSSISKSARLVIWRSEVRIPVQVQILLLKSKL